jgi:iron complex transport system ATP-binding protein
MTQQLHPARQTLQTPQPIQVRDLEAGYGDAIVIPRLNLVIPPGKMTVIIGPNGCGKSTLLKTIGRILVPRKGEVVLDGESIRRQSPKAIARRMAILPQSPVAPEGLLVRELVAYGRYPHQKLMGGLSQEDHSLIDWAMEVTGSAELADRVVSELSGGQRQRVWIAMALAQKTDILILDEPTTFLDMANQLEILTLLRELNQKTRATILIVMHELNNAIRFADHIVGMKAGTIVFDGSRKDVITKENLRLLYDIEATLQMDKNDEYPICVNYELTDQCGIRTSSS